MRTLRHGTEPRPRALTGGMGADNQAKIASVGGIDRILAAMETFNNISAVVEYGCAAAATTPPRPCLRPLLAPRPSCPAPAGLVRLP